MPNKIIKNNGNAGELSDNIAGRTDIAKYYNGWSRLINGIPLPYGGVTKRSGTKYIATAKSKNRLLKFSFSATDSMMLEMGNLYIRFYKNGDRIYEDPITLTAITKADPAVVTSVGHGYTTGDWAFLSVSGMSEVDERTLQITKLTNDTFSLQDTNGNDIDSSAYTAFTSGTASKVYQITSPYDSDEVFEIHTVQSADVIYIAHGDFAPRKLSRVADNSWTLAEVDFEGGPFNTLNTTDTTSLYTSTSTHTRSGTDYYFPVNDTGTITFSTATLLGTVNDVGTKWLVEHTRTDNKDTKTGTGNWTISGAANPSHEIPIKGDFSVNASNFVTSAPVTDVVLERKQGNGDWQEYRTFTSAVAFSSTEKENDAYYRVTVNNAGADTKVNITAKEQINKGIVEVTAHSSTTSASVTVKTAIGGEANSGTATSASKDWAKGDWTEDLGYPNSVTFYEDRLWWGGSTGWPQNVWGSVGSKYEDHTKGIDDNDAVRFTINDNDVSQIQFLAAKELLIVGTSNKEYFMSANNPDEAITATDIKVKPKSSHGSGSIQPNLLNDALFFEQGQGRKIRALRVKPDLIESKADDATLLANHLFELDPIQFGSQQMPDSILWVVRSDGTLCSLTYEPEEQVAGWARHITGSALLTPIGFFESVAVIKGSIEDEVWVSIKRIIDGNTERYIERMETRFADQEDEVVMLDSSVIATGGFDSQNIILASDTVRCGAGSCGSSRCGGTVS